MAKRKGYWKKVDVSRYLDAARRKVQDKRRRGYSVKMTKAKVGKTYHYSIWIWVNP